MFTLNEEKLRAAFAEGKKGTEPEGYGWVAPFDPMSIDADDLHRIVDDCLERDIIEKDDPRAMMAVYPQAISDSEPLLSVNPGGGPMLLGGEAVHHVSEEEASMPEDRSVIALRALVEDANALYASLTVLIEEAQRPLKDIVCLADDERPHPETSIDYRDAVEARLDRIALEARQGLNTAPGGLLTSKEPTDGR
jgi:hypothetical protein